MNSFIFTLTLLAFAGTAHSLSPLLSSLLANPSAETLRASIDAVPQNETAIVLLHLGIEAGKAGDMAQAIEWLERAKTDTHAKGKILAQIHANIAITKGLMGEHETAATELVSAGMLDPEMAGIWDMAGDALYSSGRRVDASRAYMSGFLRRRTAVTDWNSKMAGNTLHAENVLPRNTGAKQLKMTRQGMMLVRESDRIAGRAIIRYGEYVEKLLALLYFLIAPGSTVVQIGAGIGALTVPLTRIVGAQGLIAAVEPHHDLYLDLCANLAINSISNVFPMQGYLFANATSSAKKAASSLAFPDDRAPRAAKQHQFLSELFGARRKIALPLIDPWRENGLHMDSIEPVASAELDQEAATSAIGVRLLRFGKSLPCPDVIVLRGPGLDDVIRNAAACITGLQQDQLPQLVIEIAVEDISSDAPSSAAAPAATMGLPRGIAKITAEHHRMLRRVLRTRGYSCFWHWTPVVSSATVKAASEAAPRKENSEADADQDSYLIGMHLLHAICLSQKSNQKILSVLTQKLTPVVETDLPLLRKWNYDQLFPSTNTTTPDTTQSKPAQPSESAEDIEGLDTLEGDDSDIDESEDESLFDDEALNLLFGELSELEKQDKETSGKKQKTEL